MAADGPSAPRLPTPPRASFASRDRLEEGVTGPSHVRRPPCAAGAVRTSCSWAILKLMHASINAGGDACIGRLFTSRPTRSTGERVQPGGRPSCCQTRPWPAANITATNSPKRAPKRIIPAAPRQTKTVMKSTGWGTWIRTKIDGVRVRSSTVELSPNGPLGALLRARRRGGQ